MITVTLADRHFSWQGGFWGMLEGRRAMLIHLHEICDDDAKNTSGDPGER